MAHAPRQRQRVEEPSEVVAPAPPAVPSVPCPALPGWLLVPDLHQAVWLQGPARLRLKYDDMAWTIERTWEAGGSLTTHRIAGHYTDEDGAFSALLALCGLRPVRPLPGPLVHPSARPASHPSAPDGADGGGVGADSER